MGKQVANAKKGTKSSKKTTHKFFINCRLPIEDNVIVLKDFEQFLAQKIKVDNKTGNLGNSITVNMDKDQIAVESKIPLSKRYLKYLTKKYLKSQSLKEYLRVISTSKNTYELRYFKIQNEEAAE